MTHFWGKILVENFEEKLNHINSDEILSNFCSPLFCLILTQFEKNAFENSSFVRFVRII